MLVPDEKKWKKTNLIVLVLGMVSLFGTRIHILFGALALILVTLFAISSFLLSAVYGVYYSRYGGRKTGTMALVLAVLQVTTFFFFFYLVVRGVFKGTELDEAQFLIIIGMLMLIACTCTVLMVLFRKFVTPKLNIIEKEATWWFQRADLSSEEKGRASREKIKTFLKETEWNKELEFKQQREQNGKESCYPGLGINQGRRLLHIYATSNNSFNHFKVDAQGKKTEEKNKTALEIIAEIDNFFKATNAKKESSKVKAHKSATRTSPKPRRATHRK